MLTLDLTIQEEAVEKLIDQLKVRNKLIEEKTMKTIFGKIPLDTSREIHGFVRALINIGKEIDPTTKLNPNKIEALKGVLPEPSMVKIEKELKSINFVNEVDRITVYNYIKKSLN